MLFVKILNVLNVQLGGEKFWNPICNLIIDYLITNVKIFWRYKTDREMQDALESFIYLVDVIILSLL